MLNRSIDPWTAQQFDDIERQAKERLRAARHDFEARCMALADAMPPTLAGVEYVKYVRRIDEAYGDYLDAADAICAWVNEEMERLTPPLPPLPPDPRRTLH